jgi:lysophospholipase L1-like esterase
MKSLTAHVRAVRLTVGALVLALVAVGIGAAALNCTADMRCVFFPFINSAREPSAVTPPLVGLAILGDSTQDEYRADDSRGGAYGDTTFNWVELLARFRKVDVGAWGERDEPRRGGYEYNWARSAATTQTMIASGQHTGVARQIRAGQVSHVLIQIGINDIYQQELWKPIVEDRLRGVELHARLDAMAANVDVAVSSLEGAGDVQVMLAATQDYATPDVLPEVKIILADPVKRRRLIDAFAYLNQQLRQVADRHQIVFFDYNAALQAELARRDDGSNRLIIGAEAIDLNVRGDDPRHGMLDDQYAHPGTVLSAITANLYIERMNAAFGTTIAPFSDEEIIRIAGIRP